MVTSFEEEKSWVIDLGYSLEMKEGGVVQLGNNKACKVYGISTIRLKMFGNRKFLLHVVRHVPELKQNLLSIIIFDDLGYCTKIAYTILKIICNMV